jgi:hypothetical protein
MEEDTLYVKSESTEDERTQPLKIIDKVTIPPPHTSPSGNESVICKSRIFPMGEAHSEKRSSIMSCMPYYISDVFQRLIVQ